MLTFNCVLITNVLERIESCSIGRYIFEYTFMLKDFKYNDIIRPKYWWKLTISGRILRCTIISLELKSTYTNDHNFKGKIQSKINHWYWKCCHDDFDKMRMELVTILIELPITSWGRQRKRVYYQCVLTWSLVKQCLTKVCLVRD